ncbi:MAG: hypothetical protein K2F98_07435, partial [Bacteroides sp.]|nr:hypothetical protein [Bacteroides sp.]
YIILNQNRVSLYKMRLKSTYLCSTYARLLPSSSPLQFYYLIVSLPHQGYYEIGTLIDKLRFIKDKLALHLLQSYV